MLRDVRQVVELTANSAFPIPTEEGEPEVKQNAVSFYCRIDASGVAGNVVVQVVDSELRDQNRAQVRRDQQEFQEKVWDVEDHLIETGD